MKTGNTDLKIPISDSGKTVKWDFSTCCAKYSLLEGYVDCLSGHQRHLCLHVLHFGNSHFCLHPQRMEITARSVKKTTT